ncbi:unnamed protein product [Chilo suppressalis]|uniref:Uncharacterized protein n=1 Tax=Chilo suppressalis TaxID=168631 RepID=A0ABN8B5G0_CHISP|nr:unnamed protein product [Chilo suppressalis]
MFNLLIVVSLVALVKSHDLTVGSDVAGSNKIFDEDRYVNPAIWKQIQNVTINATVNQVISKVVITDMRPEKDGEVKILEGGEGQDNITLELKSPTALRGFAFHIEAYSAPKDKVKVTATTPKVEEPLHPGQTRQRRDHQDDKTDEVNFKAPATTFKGTTYSDASLTHPLATADTKINDENKKLNSNPEHVRPARDVNYDKATESAKDKQTLTHSHPISTLRQDSTENPHQISTAKSLIEISGNNDGRRAVRDSETHGVKDGQTLTHPISTFKQASTENPHQLSSAKSLIEESRNNDGKRAVRDSETHGVKEGQTLSHPISTLKQASTEYPHQISTAKSPIDQSRNVDGKRAVRDTETDEEESDDSVQTRRDGSYDHDSHVPTTVSTENHEFKRQVSQHTENNRNSTRTTNNGAYVPPAGFANSDPTNVKSRVVRDTEEKKVNSPPFVTSNDAKSTLPSTSNTNNQNSGGKIIPGQRPYRQTNTATPRNLTPLPYATSSTTEKSQNKRDTAPKTSDKNQAKAQVNLRNTPRPLRQRPKVAEKDPKQVNKQAPVSTH